MMVSNVNLLAYIFASKLNMLVLVLKILKQISFIWCLA